MIDGKLTFSATQMNACRSPSLFTVLPLQYYLAKDRRVIAAAFPMHQATEHMRNCGKTRQFPP